MAGRPLRPATDRRLGRPLPYQLANPTSAHPIAQGLAVPCFHPKVVCGISQSFDWLFPTTGQIPKHYSPVRRSSACIATPVTARLACVKHAASVQSEPGSNSSLEDFELQLRVIKSSLLDFWSLGLRIQKDTSTRVPTQITCQTFKQHPEPLGLGKGPGSIAPSLDSSTRIRCGETDSSAGRRARARDPVHQLSLHLLLGLGRPVLPVRFRCRGRAL